MKIVIHSTTFDGKPLEADGKILGGKTALEVVQAMQCQTPFTLDTTLDEYMKGILEQIGEAQEHIEPEEFLSILAQRRLIGFLPDDAFIETIVEDGRVCECADKQV